MDIERVEGECVETFGAEPITGGRCAAAFERSVLPGRFRCGLQRTLLLVIVLVSALLVAGHATAGESTEEEIVLSLDDFINEPGDSLYPSSQTYDPELPITGWGTIDVEGASGTLSLPDYSVILDVDFGTGFGEDDARLDIVGWTQNITAIDGSGNISSTGAGTVTCESLSAFGSLICGSVPPEVQGWPPRNLQGAVAGSAMIDEDAKTITVIDATQPALAGVNTQYFSYTVPEPGAALSAMAAIVPLALMRRRRPLS
jgi:hypothetical protein